MRHYDVVIIGSGPAGSTSGYFLASRGLNVVIIEKEKHPRNKLCGGILTENTICFNETYLNENVKNLEKNKIIDFSSKKYELIFDNVRYIGDTKIPYYFVKREKYDEYLMKKALYNGAIIIENKRVDKIDLKNKHLMVKNKNGISYSCLIAADGVNSVIRNKYFFLNSEDLKNWYKEIGISIQIRIDRKDISPQINHPQMYFTEIQDGYGWVFPNNKQIIIGLGGSLKLNKDIGKSFVKFLSKFDIKKIPKKCYSLMPYGNYVRNCVYRNIILIGDAAGLVDPFTGEGIYYAQKSGEIAARVIIDHLENKTPLLTYNNRIKNEIITDFKFSEYSRLLIK